MVISIISLLSSIVLGYVGSTRAKARDTVRLNDMQQINTAATSYYQDEGEAPSSIEELVSTGYLSAVPKDPTGVPYNQYATTTNKGKVFTASATYETIKKQDGTKQEVGVVISNGLTISDICIILSAIGQFPNCSGSTLLDQVVGISSGSRLTTTGDSGTTTGNLISDCSLAEINKECPDNITNGCYCGGGKYADGLLWQYPDPNISKNWYDAKTYCEDIGWRLPMVEQLQHAISDQFLSFVDDSYGENPGGFKDYFSNGMYWSGTTYEYDDGFAYFCDSFYIVSASSKVEDRLVRCVK